MRIQDLSSGIFSRSVVLVLLTFLPFSRGWAQDLDHQRRQAGEGRPSTGEPPAGTKVSVEPLMKLHRETVPAKE